MFDPTSTGIPMMPLHANVTQGMSETADLPEPYCVKQNTERSWCTNVIATQHDWFIGDRDMGL
jgi:hypothetical protein